MFQYTAVPEEIQAKAEVKDFGRFVDVLYVDPDPFFKDYQAQPTRVTERYRKQDQSIKRFKVRDDDVFVISYPKTGTTVLSELLTVLLNGMDFSKIPDQPLIFRSPYLDLSGFIETPVDFIPYCDAMTTRRAIKLHITLNLLPTEMLSKSKHKMIYTVRNPKDAAISEYHHFKNLHGFVGTLEDHLDLYLTGDVAFGSYFRHVEEYLRLSKVKDNLLLVTYEDMVTDMPSVIRKIIAFLEIPLTDEEVAKVAEYVHFDNMKQRKCSNNEPVEDGLGRIGSVDAGGYKFMRKGKKDSHKEEMSPEYIARFNAEMAKWKGVMELYPNF